MGLDHLNIKYSPRRFSCLYSKMTLSTTSRPAQPLNAKAKAKANKLEVISAHAARDGLQGASLQAPSETGYVEANSR